MPGKAQSASGMPKPSRDGPRTHDLVGLTEQVPRIMLPRVVIRSVSAEVGAHPTLEDSRLSKKHLVERPHAIPIVAQGAVLYDQEGIKNENGSPEGHGDHSRRRRS